MPDDESVVLPETLVAELISKVGDAAKRISGDLRALGECRDQIRRSLLSDRKIRSLGDSPGSAASVMAVDGAHVTESDRASAYALACAVCVGDLPEQARQISCMAVVPHITSIGALSAGLMFMQEIMLAVKAAREHEDAVVVVDGSRITAIIKINQFYVAAADDFPELLETWRNDKDDDAGHVIRAFESEDWLKDYLNLPNIVGNLKLVTTNLLVGCFAQEHAARFDDKTIAALVLQPGEYIIPLPVPAPSGADGRALDPPYHIHRGYPFAAAFEDHARALVGRDGGARLHHLYYRPRRSQAISKIECNRAFIGPDTLGGLFSWWEGEMCAVDMLEPYSCVIADRFAKEGVSVSTRALKEIVRRSGGGEWGWYFSDEHRS